jgi:hypothetical protein
MAAGTGHLAAPEGRRQQPLSAQHPPESDFAVLAFADLPSDLAQLRAFDSAHLDINNRPSSQNPNTPVSTHDTAIASQPSSNSAAHTQPRKPSPGLAARLKALGFGASTKASPPPPPQHDQIGRLPEDQLRQLDENHQAGSNATIVERRGRPWKGAIARIPSVSSLRSTKTVDRSASKVDNQVKDDAARRAAAAPKPGPAPELLPEIDPSRPLEMDTNKYRLPDHTNGNGTKVQLDTRLQHLGLDARAPPSPDVPPPPLPKDTPPVAAGHASAPSQEFNPDAISYFNPLGLQRPGSIYTLSRASFANQLAQLTSLQLPDAESLSSKVSAIPTARAATGALIGAAEQIRNWIFKASEVIDGLDSDDDVEWAAAGGREGLEEVENAIARFEELIHVYVSAIEELQSRSDIASVSSEDLGKAVEQMEGIMEEWGKMRKTLQSVKAQVEIAMEWEELWNMVLGDIQNEMDELSRLVFEMEERRHKSIMAATSGDGVDIGDLETIVEETPPHATRLQAAAANHRFSLPVFPVSPSSPSTPALSQDDSSLLALFARMQPLRASLDFLPMRLSVFEARADKTFPTACEELEMRRSGLDGSYKKLEKDAESLRKELGEDRWVTVFRGAARQAQKMYESVERSVAKVKEAVDAGLHLTNQPMMAKKIEGYETKKTHYGPAIERVIGIIDKGVKERLTVNGEILRIHAEMQGKWDVLKDRMREMDLTLEELQSDKKGQQLRDSISSMLSNDRSTIGSGNETPQSSPPSSVIMSSLGFETTTPTNKKNRRSSITSHLPQPANRRSVSATGVPSQPTRKPISRFSTLGPPTPSREGSATPVGARAIPRPASTLGHRPRWNGSTTGIDTGHNFKPLSAADLAPIAKQGARTPNSISSKLPMLRSPLGRSGSASPIPEDADTPSKPPSSHRMSFRERLASPGPYAQQTLSKPRLTSQASMSALTNRRASFQPPRTVDNTAAAAATPRPASSLASTRRNSLLPTPKKEGSVTGRESPQAVAGARFAMRKKTTDNKPPDNRPRWRG